MQSYVKLKILITKYLIVSGPIVIPETTVRTATVTLESGLTTTLGSELPTTTTTTITSTTARKS